MPGKTPHNNGNEPLENGIQKNKDVEMTDEKSSAKGKAGKKAAKEGEDMTVVVPPSKNSKKSSAPPAADGDGDVSMDDSENPNDLEVKVDPVTQAVAGMFVVVEYLLACFAPSAPELLPPGLMLTLTTPPA